MAKPNMKSSGSGRFNDHPKPLSTAGTPRNESGRIKSIKTAWGATTNELSEHKNQGIMVEPIKRAKIAAGLQRDHHRSERTSGKTRGIIKGKV